MPRKNKQPPRTGKVERQYARQLRKIARHIGDIISAFPPGDPAAVPLIKRTLEGYSETITGWATVTASQMLSGVDKANLAAWREHTAGMSDAIKIEVARAPTGTTMQRMLAEQVALIKSIPTEAGQRVQELTIAALEDSSRSKEIAQEIARSQDVAASRATLIARTEVARTASKLTESRARHVGSEGYIWRTTNDSDVRDSHRQMNGKYVRWDSPPTLSDGTTTHAGQIYNCRCYPEPVIADEN